MKANYTRRQFNKSKGMRWVHFEFLKKRVSNWQSIEKATKRQLIKTDHEGN